MDLKTFAGLVARHVLTAVAAWLASRGILAVDGSQAEAFVGAGMFFASVGWSAWQKWRANMVTAIVAKLPAVAPPNATVTEATKLAEAAAKQAA